MRIVFHRNFQFASKLRSEGIYMINRSSERPNQRKPFQPVKVMLVDGLKRALRYVNHHLTSADTRFSFVYSSIGHSHFLIIKHVSVLNQTIMCNIYNVI
jgi:hypothetical protein